ncbi:MAG: hypothetical protein ACLU9S_07420 [Oscillospiraceae bacterium]
MSGRGRFRRRWTPAWSAPGSRPARWNCWAAERSRGRRPRATILLNGSLEQDKIFAVGDKALVVISYQGDTILSIPA